MACRKLPRIFLFSDPQRGDPIAAIARLPRGAAVIFRHYDAPDRAALAQRVRAACRRRGVLFLPADAPGSTLMGDGLHRPAHRVRGHRRWPPGLRTAAAHDNAELMAAARAGADLVFVSPVHPTASHPGARSLGRVRFALLARRARIPVAALGGMTSHRFRALRALGAVAWGAVAAHHR
ncbi:MAG: thiamine phosphate synthase [Sphingomonadaceae bacterium]|nr:thiamine phosphate synthase [Sphingomonadaceae bacterium]